MVRAELVPDIARSCGERGVKHIVVLSSGFEETDFGAVCFPISAKSLPRSSPWEWSVPTARTLVRARTHHSHLRECRDARAAHFGAGRRAEPERQHRRRRHAQLNDVGVGADVFVSVGDQTVLGVADYLRWVVRRASVKVVVCFLEGLADGRAFLQAASAAREAGVAVVVLKAGTSEKGREASASHTGKISSAATVYDSLLAQAGVMQVDTIDELATAAAIIAGPPLRALLLTGGRADSAWAVWWKPEHHRRRYRPPRHSARDAGRRNDRQAETFIPDFGVTTNPVDPTGQVLSDPALFPRTIEAELALGPRVPGGPGSVRQRRYRTFAHSSPGARRGIVRTCIPMVVSCLLDQLPASDPLAPRAERSRDHVCARPDRGCQGIVAALPRTTGPQSGHHRAMRPLDDRSVMSWSEVEQFVAAAGLSVPRAVTIRADADQAASAAEIVAIGSRSPSSSSLSRTPSCTSPSSGSSS